MKKTTDPIDRHVGARIRLRRQELGMSQEELGRAIDLTFQQVQKYERGINRIGAGRLYRIAGALGVPITWFFEGLPDPAREPTPAPEKPLPTMACFLASPEGHALSEAFTAIGDLATRRRLVDLVRTIAAAERA
jgi:transcriptional regulator with XRE-family HTH domain